MFEIHQCSLGGATSTDLLGQTHYYKAIDPDIVIVQVGIVDCTPRFVTKKEKYLLTKIPVIGNKIIGFINHSFVRKHRNITYILKNQFLKNLNTLKIMFKIQVNYFL